MPAKSYHCASFLIPRDLYSRLQTYAIYQRVAVSVVIRECIQTHLEILEERVKCADFLYEFTGQCLDNLSFRVSDGLDTFHSKEGQDVQSCNLE